MVDGSVHSIDTYSPDFQCENLGFIFLFSSPEIICSARERLCGAETPIVAYIQHFFNWQFAQKFRCSHPEFLCFAQLVFSKPWSSNAARKFFIIPHSAKFVKTFLKKILHKNFPEILCKVHKWQIAQNRCLNFVTLHNK